MRILSILLIFLFFGNCNKGNSQNLENDILLKKYFNKNEINDLKKILLFFDEEISKNCDDSLISCYQTYFSNVADYYKKRDLYISKKRQLELFNNISESTFNKIWRNSQSTISTKTHSKTIDVIMLKYDSDYMNYLKETGTSNLLVFKYSEMLNDMGAIIHAGMLVYYLFHANDFDFNNENERLIMAIHYMTVSEEFK